MKKSIVIPFSVSALTILSARADVHPPKIYEVKKGDSFSSIVQRYALKDNRKLSFSSPVYLSSFERFKKLNPQVKNLNHIEVGDKILIPSIINKPAVLAKKNTKLIQEYKVKYGDTILQVLKDAFKQENPWHLIGLLKELNPGLKDIDFIRSEDILLIPRRGSLASFYSSDDKRKPAAIEKKLKFKSNFLLEQEIFTMSKADARSYVEHFRNIKNAKDKTQVMRELKSALDKSRHQEFDKLEDAFVLLLGSAFKSKEEDFYLENIKAFFEVWTDLRSQRNKI